MTSLLVICRTKQNKNSDTRSPTPPQHTSIQNGERRDCTLHTIADVGRTTDYCTNYIVPDTNFRTYNTYQSI